MADEGTTTPPTPATPAAPAAAPLPAAPGLANLPAAAGGPSSTFKQAYESYKTEKATADAAAKAALDAERAPVAPADAEPASAPAAATPAAATVDTPEPAAHERLTQGSEPPAADDAGDEAEPDAPEVEAGDDAPADAGEAGEPAEIDPDDPLYVELPSRQPNGEPIKLLAPDPETKEAIQRLQNGYARGEELRQGKEAIAHERAEYDEFATRLRSDPIGVVLESMSAEQGIALARQLLALEPIRRELEADGLSVHDDEAVERMKLRSEAARERTKRAAESAIQVERQVRQNAQDLHAMFVRLMPDGLSAEQQAVFLRDCRRDITSYQQDNRLQTVPPRNVPQILQDRLAIYGVDAAERLNRKTGQRQGAGSKPAAARAPAAVRPAAPPRTFARVQQQQKAKQLIAASAPGAHSTDDAGRNRLADLPKNATIAAAIQHARRVMGSPA